MRTLVIGRSPFADIVIADPSVAPHHAELVVTEDGRLHLTDCATESGTWRQDPSTEVSPEWQRVRQAFIRSDEPLRLGDYHCTATDLLRAVREGGASTAEGSPRSSWDLGGGSERRLRGRVERDIATGEIVRRRP